MASTLVLTGEPEDVLPLPVLAIAFWAAFRAALAEAEDPAVPEPALLLDADLTRLAQVISNLLNNASKYTQPGGRIWLSGGREGQKAVVRVRDNGIGIRPKMLCRVFDLFAQSARARPRSRGGLGIGLTLVRRLVEMHGGRVEAHSEGPGKGAEFVVRVPIRTEWPASSGKEAR